MNIGELAQRAGTSRDTIRYYEKLGLLPIINRQNNNRYKNYGLPVLERLEQIKRLKAAGFALLEIREFLCQSSSSSGCTDLLTRLAEKIVKIDEHIENLNRLKSSLIAIQTNCNGNCDMIRGVPGCVPTSDI